MLYLTVEDIVANSIIELNKIDGSRKVMIEDAKRYGEEVANHLKKRGYYTLLKLKPNLTESFEIKYENYFTKYYENESYGYMLNDDKEIKDIEAIFRLPIAYEVVESFTSSEVIEKSFPSLCSSQDKIAEIKPHCRIKRL